MRQEVQEFVHILRAKHSLFAKRHCCELDRPILKLLEAKAIGKKDMLLLPT